MYLHASLPKAWEAHYKMIDIWLEELGYDVTTINGKEIKMM